ncbi:MAG TPA: S8 family serine peptidase [Abditibacteriaceae bacterium]
MRISFFHRALLNLFAVLLLCGLRHDGLAQTPERVSVRTPRGVVKAKAGELLVKFTERPTDLSLRGIRANAGRIRAKAVQANRRIGATEIESFDFIGWQLVRLPKKVTLEEAIAFYQSQPDVLAVEPNVEVHLEATPNDPKFTEQYSHAKISAPLAWDRTKGSNTVVVAVIDNGVDYRHPDLAANMWRNPGETAGNGIDDDGNGYIDDVYGIDAAMGDSDPTSEVAYDANGVKEGEHGTHVAGIIGSVGNNGIGTTGVMWNVKIMALRALAPNAAFADATLRCLRYATVMKQRGINIRVTNNSYGGYGAPNQAEKDAFDSAGAVGILNVCSAGNKGQDNEAAFHSVSDYTSESILAVAATEENDKRADYSNWGKVAIDLAAPGSNIWSTVPTAFDPAGYAQSSGTSMASPCVAGAAALVSSINPNFSVAQLKSTLMNTVDRLSWWEGLTVTGGRLNLARAVAAADPNGLPVVESASPNGVVNVLRPSLVVTFNKPMNPTSVQAAWSVTPAIAGTFAWSNNNQTLTFTPGGNLPSGTSYLGRIKGTATSAAGQTIDSNLNRVANGSPDDDYTWTFRIAGAPNNDNFANAILLSGDTGVAPGNNTTATRETGEPNHGGTFSQGDKSVWYKWTAPALGNIYFNTKGSSFENVIGIYTGNSVGTLTRITGDGYSTENAATTAWRTVPGTTYFIAVDGTKYGAETTTGNILLNWKLDRSPANDMYAGAQTITGLNGNTTGTTFGAYVEDGEDYHDGRESSVWFKWTAPANGAVTFDTEGTLFDTTLNAFTGDSINSERRIAQDNDGGSGSLSKMPFTCVAGTTYYITVGGNGTAFDEPRGPFKLKWVSVAAPPNDLFANSTVLDPATGGSATGTNVGANLETGEFDPTYGRGLSSIWYSWTAPTNGVATFSTAGSAIDTVLTVSTGAVVNALTQVDINDDDAALNGLKTSRVRFTAVAGTTYRIRIDNAGYATSEASIGFPATHGTIKLAWTFAGAPANDLFTNAQTLTTANGQVSGTNVGANVETGEFDPTYGSGGESVWYRWTAPATGRVTFSTQGSKTSAGLDYNTDLAVFTGTQVNALTSVAENNDDAQAAPNTWSRVRYTAIAGTTYFLRVDNGGYASGDSAQKYDASHGTVALRWEFAAAPINDNFSGAIDLQPRNAGRITGTTIGATLETGEFDPTYGSGGESIWFTWTAPAAGTVDFNTTGSKTTSGNDYNTHLGVYTGGFVTGLTDVASNNDDGALVTSRVSFTAQGGTTYRIRVDNGGYTSGDSAQKYDAAHGTVALTWSLNGAPVTTPVITSLTPDTGVAGTRVTIGGSGFTGTTAVSFDGIAATINSVSSSSIVATAPAGVRTGRISVTAPGGTGISPMDFKVLPTVSSFTPTSGAPSAKVTITGTGFSGVSKVSFGGVEADYLVNSPTQIVATVPATALTGRIAITTAGGLGQSTVDFVVTPRITSFTPASGAVGSRVTISGANFLGATAVKFNGVAAASPTVAATSISVLVPAGATSGRITVTTPAGTATSPTGFVVVQLPAITNFTPAIGKAGTSVTVTGSNFTGANSVTFNGVAAAIASNSGTSLVVTVPAGATTGRIAITTPAGTGTSATNFVVDATLPVATISNPLNNAAVKVLPAAFSGTVSDNSGIGNVSSVSWYLRRTLNGAYQYWDTTTQSWTSAIIYNATSPARPATTTAWSSVGTLPSGTTNLPDGTYTLVVRVRDAVGNTGATSSTFLVDTTVPTISISAPTNGAILTTLPTALSGSVNDNSGIARVKSVTWDLRRTVNGAYQYWNTATQSWGTTRVGNTTTPARPATTTAWSSVGALPTGTTNLPDGAYTVMAYVGDAASNSAYAISTVTIRRVASVSIAGRVTLGTAGIANVRITRSGTTATVLTNTNGDYVLTGVPGSATYTVTPSLSGYTFSPTSLSVAVTTANVTGKNFAATKVPAPTISSFTPSTGAVGTAVTITGTNFSGATAVKFNGVAATLTSNSATQIVTKVPTGATTGTISVTTPGGTVTSTATFTVPAADTTKPIVSITTPAANASYASLATATGTASDAGTGVQSVYVELYRYDVTGAQLTHIFNWTTGKWTTDNTEAGITAPATGTTSWSRVLPTLGAGIYELYATALDGATPANQADWISRKFTITTVANNNFAAALVIKGTSGQVSGGNKGANKETGEPANAGSVGGASVWYSWTPASSGTVTFSTAGSSFDTVMSIYKGTSVGALTVVTSNDDEQPGTITTSKATFNAVAGTNYRIAVDGYDGETGDIVLSWTQIVGVTTNAGPESEATPSPVKLSSATARVAGAVVQLHFTGALDSDGASDPARYIVAVNGRKIACESARSGDNGTTVTLTLDEGELHTGDKVTVSWQVPDSAGRQVTGITGQISAL